MKELITFDSQDDYSNHFVVIGIGNQTYLTIQDFEKRGLKNTDFMVVNEEISSERLTKYKLVFLVSQWNDQTDFEIIYSLVRLSKELDILTIGVIPLPSFNIGRQRIEEFMAILDTLKTTMDLLLVISENQLESSYGPIPQQELVEKHHSLTWQFLSTVNNLSFTLGFVCVDFSDVVCAIRKSHFGFFTSGKAKGENRATEAVKNAIESQLAGTKNIFEAKNLMIAVSGNDDIEIDEVVAIVESLVRSANKDCNIFWNYFFDKDLDESIKINIVATGLDEPPLYQPFSR